MNRKLVFIYNASSDIWSKYLDIGHKIVSPSTYTCSLCELTHGNFSEKKIWKDFRETINDEFVFQYKNDFLKMYQDDKYKEFYFPIVLEEKENKFDILINTEELNSMVSVENLIKRLKKILG